MIAVLEKSDAAQGFEQIIDFLSGSYIHHAITVNLHVYISCIKQFWNTAVVKRLGDVTRLQALVDKKRIVITEAVVRELLQLDDAEGVICLPNDEIFAGLARMGYEKPSTKLTFYKAFFSTQWKFLIHTILHSLSAKRTSWNEFSSAMASALICLSSGQRFNFSKYIFESLVLNVDSPSKFYMYPRFIQLIIQSNIDDLSKHTNRYISPVLTQKVFANMRRIRKGFSGVETPLFENMLRVRAVDAEEEMQKDHLQWFSRYLKKCSALVLRVEGLENANAAQQLEIVKLKARVKKLEKLNKVKSSKLRRLKKFGTSQHIDSSEDEENVFNQGRISVDIDEGIELDVDQEKNAKIEERQVDTQAEIYNIDLDHSSKVLSMREDIEVQEAVEVVTTAKLITEVVVVASTPIPAAKLVVKPKVLKFAVVAPTVSTRKRKGVVIRDPEEELHNDTPAETLSKEEAQRLSEEAQKKTEEAQEADDLRGHLEIVPNEDDDVFVEAVPLAQKALIVDYQVVVMDNKLKYKIIRADDTHQFYISLTTLLKNFDREDLETLWRIVKDRFSTKKPTNFSDEYLLLTLKTMFGELDAQDAIWRNQKSVNGLSLVKR
nr:hypothetical protein [Tanacetum cinerariifolium]